MKRKFLTALMAALALSLLVAAVGQATTTLTLADLLIPGTTLTIDDKLFFDFQYTGSGTNAAAIVPSAIGVTPITTPLNPGLQFNAAWSVGPGQVLDSFIQYEVRVLPGGSPITDVSATMAGLGINPNGTASVSENVTLNDFFPFGTSLANLFLHADGGTVAAASATFAGTTGPVFVIKDIAVNGNSGSAAISQVTNQFSETPIPVPPTALLLGSGLLGLVGLRRKFLG